MHEQDGTNMWEVTGAATDCRPWKTSLWFVMRPCGALGSCCPLKNADSGQAEPPTLCAGLQDRHVPGCHPSCLTDERKRTTSSVPTWALKLRKHRAQDSTSSITKSRTRFPRALSAQFPVSRSSWEAKGNPSPDTLARQLTDSAFSDSWWGPCSAQHSEPPSYRGKPCTWHCSLSTDTRCRSPSPTHRSSTFSHYIFSGCTKERLKEVIEECQLHRNKFHGDIIAYLLQEKKNGGQGQKPECGGHWKATREYSKIPTIAQNYQVYSELFSDSENNGALVRGFPEI